MSNALREFLSLVPDAPLLVGEVTAIANELRTVTLPDGATITARGVGSVGQQVFVRAGKIEGVAPALPVVEITL
ncbi:hypothetical protein [Accumulibacter sp.]|uniref:hypothetical protein n=1 Tax=Accumulibacter sp. TaxID=2053492 RepID=UPI0026091944|nr:hypothetical protein [Accumulibacter sp.]